MAPRTSSCYQSCTTDFTKEQLANRVHIGCSRDCCASSPFKIHLRCVHGFEMCAAHRRLIKPDAIVNHFLNVVNYRYTAIYGPSLTTQYVDWWAHRTAGRRLSPEFTCLLLRICAYTVQYLTPNLSKMIEFELASNSQVLTDRFAAAADQLSQSFEASSISVERVQEQFLRCAWLVASSDTLLPRL